MEPAHVGYVILASQKARESVSPERAALVVLEALWTEPMPPGAVLAGVCRVACQADPRMWVPYPPESIRE